MNGKINSHQTFYSNELKKSSDSKKSGAGLDDTCESKWAHFFEIWLVCFKLISLCKHRVWCYIFWFRKCVKLIWPCISGLKVTIETFSKLRFSGFKKFVTRSVLGSSNSCRYQLILNFLLRLKSQTPGGKTVCGFFSILISKGVMAF